MSAASRRVGAVVLGSLLVAGTAHGYVRSRTQTGVGVPIKWRSTTVTVVPNSSASPDLPLATVVATFQKSVEAWAGLIGPCAYLNLELAADQVRDAHYDFTNTLVFRSDKWCHPNDDRSDNVCYDASAAAITTVFYVDSQGNADDGKILDADIEFNNINFTFINAPSMTAARAGTMIADLENTATHELGHLMGLDHTCADAASPSNEVDETGNPPTACNKLSMLSPAARAKIVDATMYNQASPGEIKKRSAEADDVAGICAAYPIGEPPGDGGGGGCAFAYSPGATHLVAFFMALASALAFAGFLRRRHTG